MHVCQGETFPEKFGDGQKERIHVALNWNFSKKKQSCRVVNPVGSFSQFCISKLNRAFSIYQKFEMVNS